MFVFCVCLFVVCVLVCLLVLLAWLLCLLVCLIVFVRVCLLYYGSVVLLLCYIVLGTSLLVCLLACLRACIVCSPWFPKHRGLWHSGNIEDNWVLGGGPRPKTCNLCFVVSRCPCCRCLLAPRVCRIIVSSRNLHFSKTGRFHVIFPGGVIRDKEVAHSDLTQRRPHTEKTSHKDLAQRPHTKTSHRDLTQ